jgi:hypothetical protein
VRPDAEREADVGLAPALPRRAVPVPRPPSLFIVELDDIGGASLQRRTGPRTERCRRAMTLDLSMATGRSGMIGQRGVEGQRVAVAALGRRRGCCCTGRRNCRRRAVGDADAAARRTVDVHAAGTEPLLGGIF